jgi:hypothetical protein
MARANPRHQRVWLALAPVFDRIPVLSALIAGAEQTPV